MSAQVTLNGEELMIAAVAGAIRRVKGIKRRTQAYGLNGNEWQHDIEGCCAELAVAKHYGLPWLGAFMFRAPDVGEWQIRSTQLDHGSLIVHREDSPADTFLLVTGRNGSYTIRGWIRAEDAQADRYWSDPSGKGRWAFFVPQSDLHDPELLCELIGAKS
jgi:hypothetical protein